MYKHYDTTDELISLHDCKAEKLSFENGILSFYLSDGFWVLSNHEENCFEKTVKTDAAQVQFHLVDEDKYDISIYVFTWKKFRKSIRKAWKLKKFIKAINNGSCKLEFLCQYKAYNARIIECWLWFDKKPYHKECELKITTDRVTYCWNQLREDRQW